MTYSKSSGLSVFISVMILTVLFGVSACAADQVGYINIKRLIHESQIGEAAKSGLQKLRAEKQQEVVEKGQLVAQLKDYIINKKEWADPSEKKEVLEKYQKLVKEYERLLEDAKEDIAREDRELTAIILKKADSALKEVARKKEFTMILKDPDVIGYLNPKVDITDDVLKKLDKDN